MDFPDRFSPESMFRVIVFLAGLLLLAPLYHFSFCQDIIQGKLPNPLSNLGGPVAIDGDYAVAISPEGLNAPSAHLFKRDGQSWTEVAVFSPQGNTFSSRYGESIALYGNHLIVGARDDDEKGSRLGAAYIYERVGEEWMFHSKLFHDDLSQPNLFGYAVAINNSHAVVLERNSAFVYSRDGNQWVKETELTPSGGSFNSCVCGRVTMDDERIVIANTQDRSAQTTGAAYSFRRVGNTWEEEGQLLPLADDPPFGTSIALDKDKIAVGAFGGQQQGAAYFFERVDTSWVFRARVQASNGFLRDGFGVSIAISDSTAIVGMRGNTAAGRFPRTPGAIYFFRKHLDTWLEFDSYQADNPEEWDIFGSYVAIDEDWALAAAPAESATYTYSGVASNEFLRVFSFNPNEGGGNRILTMSLLGENFLPGLDASLHRRDERIPGQVVDVSSDGRSLTVVFDLESHTRGFWDLAITNPDQTQYAIPEAFHLNERTYNPTIGLIEPAFFASGHQPYDIAAADFNMDGNMDVVTGSRRTLAVQYGDGRGGFSSSQFITLDNNLHTLTTGDVNGDGVPDIILTRRLDSLRDFIVSYIGDGNGGFVRRGTDFPPPSSTGAMGAADVNMDGQDDAIVPSSLVGSMAIHLGTSTGSFVRLANYFSVDNAGITLSGDMDKDGYTDLVITNTNPGQVAVFWGDGTGKFFTNTTFSTEGTTNGLIVEDLDGDGHLEMAVADATTETVAVVIVNQDRTLELDGRYDTGMPVSFMQVGDFSGDGNLDLVFSSTSSTMLSVTPGDGSRGFGMPQFAPSTSNRARFVTGDIDKDGSRDVITINRDTGNLAIHYNFLELGILRITSITPFRGADIAPIDVTINGELFSPDSQVELVRSDESIVGQSIDVSANGRTLRTSFDLRNRTQGTWDVVITNPDGERVIFEEGFNIEAAIKNLWVDIVGRDVMRPDRKATYTIVFGNNGNIPTFGGIIKLDVSPGTGVELFSDGESIYNEVSEGTPDGSAWIHIPSIPVDRQGTVTLRLDPLGQTEGNVSVEASIFSNARSFWPVRYDGFYASTSKMSASALHVPQGAAGVQDDDACTVPWAPSQAGYVHDFWVTEFDANGNRTIEYQEAAFSLGGDQIGWSFPEINISEVNLRDIQTAQQGPNGYYEVKDASGNVARRIRLTDYGAFRPWADWNADDAAAVRREFDKWQSETLPNGNPIPFCSDMRNATRNNPINLRQPAFDNNFCFSCIGFVGFVLRRVAQEACDNGRTAACSWNPSASNGNNDTFMEYLYQQNNLPNNRTCAGADKIAFPPPGFGQSPDGKSKKDISIVNSFDPNEKSGPFGFGDGHYVPAEQDLNYIIYFENDPDSARAPAQEVFISDTLDTSKLDLRTLQLGPIVFGNTRIVPPTGVKNYSTEVDLDSILVRIDASLDEVSGILSFAFTSIDPITGEPPEFIGFLPPNQNSPEGEGHVSFSVAPLFRLPTSTEITNTASILFDTNAPIITNTWVNTIDASLPTSAVYNIVPLQSEATFSIQWNGEDEGAGIRDYSIYVQEDEGPFTLWLSQSTDTLAVFTGEPGHTYGFASIARDEAGNVEPAPLEAEQTTSAIPVSIAQEKDVEDSFALFQNYPNPFNPSTYITYRIPAPSQVSIRVFDLLGRQVAVLVDEELPTGTHKVRWDPQGLASGVYLYRMQAGEFTAVKKLMLVK